MTKQIENVDGERSHFNIDYCNENIKKVYHKLFDEALQRYNEKQTRSDRRIDNYYEKIRNSKQEKPFHELILQIGDKENMGAWSENGNLARQVLDEYYQQFQKRNPNRLTKTNEKLAGENENLRAENKNYKLLKKTFGSKQMDSLLEQAKAVQ